jgi:hypothetical protein
VRTTMATALLILLCTITASTATAHLVAHFHKGQTTSQKEHALKLDERHLAYVANHGHGEPRRAHAKALGWVKHELAQLDRTRLLNLSPRSAICAVFNPCGKALAVVDCETGGTFSIYADNGAGYLGLFQFGAYARAAYGFAWNAYLQAVYAHRYYEDAGWGPWECA